MARDLITAFLTCADRSPGLLAIALVDALSAHNKSLLDEVEREIRLRRFRTVQKKSGARASFVQARAAEFEWPIGHA
jgi:hypothetical protein